MKYILIITIAFLLNSCASNTRITGSWKNPKQPVKNYHTVFIASLTNNTIVKSTIENDMANALNKFGIKTIKSIDELPPNFKDDSLDKQSIRRKVGTIGADVIMTISSIKKETESHYTPGGYPYSPLSFGYYGNLWGYYDYWYPYTYNQGYYIENEIYFLETNLYDAKTEELLWSAQSQTYNPAGLKLFSAEFAKIIAARLKQDEVLK